MQRLLTIKDFPASSLCFGTMQFGGKSSFYESKEIYQVCRNSGINFFDTAHVYNEGRSEEFLGLVCRSERENIIIATKAAYDCPATKKNILTSFDESRKRLKSDFVDILYMHRWDKHVPLEETLTGLAELKQKGLIRYIGVSNYSAWQTMKAQAICHNLNISIDVIQPMYSLVKRQAEVEILPMALSEKISVCPYSPLGGGLLTGKYHQGDTGRLTEDQRYKQRYSLEWMHNTASNLSLLATRYNVSPSTLAIAWVSNNKSISAPIISASSLKQLSPSISALNYQMPSELYKEITDLSVSPSPATDRLEEI